MAIKLENSDFVRNLVKDHKLVGALDKVIAGDEFEWEAKFGPKYGDDAWHPSGHCVPSALTLYESALLAEEDRRPKPASLKKAFCVGHFWHAYIQHIVVEKLGWASWDEIEAVGKVRWGDGPYQWATGAADIAPCHIPVHGDYLVDIKTMSPFDYKQLGLPQWLAAKYECQINIYMDWFDLEKAIILCVQKDSPHAFKEFEFRRNQPLIDAIYSKWKLVGACLEAKEVPPEDYDIELPVLGPRL
jgi:hypothetical protein